MATYEILATNYPEAYSIFGAPKKSGYYPPTAMSVKNGVMSCCGLGEMFGFYGTPFQSTRFDEKARWFEDFCAVYWTPGHFIYTLTTVQLTNELHKAFLKIGSKEIASFENLTHGPNTIHLFLVNVRDAVGVFLDEHRKALKEEPKPAAQPVEVPAIEPVKPARKPRAKKVTGKFDDPLNLLLD